ncbi:MAG: MFS transporter [Chloroflexota bacterium]
MNNRIVPILALSVFSSMLGVGIISPLLPLYAENLGATGIWLGAVFAGFSLSRAVFMPIVGRLSDRYGRKLFLCSGLLAYAVSSLGYIWADSIPELMLVRLLHGATSGMVIPIAQAYVADISPRGKEGTWMGYFNAAFFSGFGCGPLMGGVLTDHFGLTAAFSTMGALNLLAFLLALIYLPETVHAGVTRPQLSFRKAGSSRLIRGLFSFNMSFSIYRGIFATFVPIFAALQIGLTPTLIGIVLATNILLMSLLQVYWGSIADRFPRRGLVAIGSIMNAGFLTLVPWVGSFWLLLGLGIFGALGDAIAMPAASALTIEAGRQFGMGSTVALLGVGASIGMTIGPLLGGAVADGISLSAAFYLGAVLELVGMGYFLWSSRRT